MSMLGCLVMFVIGGFSMGYALTDQVVMAIMVTLTLAGIVLGIWKRPVQEAATGEFKTNAAVLSGFEWESAWL